MMTAWLNRPSLTSVDPAALATAPGKAGERQDFLLERVVNRDGQDTPPVHLGHLSKKIQAMVRAPLENVVLPLVNHLMRKGAHELIAAIGSTGQQRFEERKGEADFTLGFMGTSSTPRRSRAGSTHEHADGRGQPSAPNNVDRRQHSVEVAAIEIGPYRGELLRGHHPNSSAIAATSNGNIIS